MDSPVVLLLKKYKKLTKDEIIGEVADWFNAVGQEEFEKAVALGLIQKNSEHPRLWELKNE